MKFTIHVPVEAFGYIEVSEIETLEEAKKIYNECKLPLTKKPVKHIDTDVSQLEDGVYVVWKDNIKQMYRKKIVYKGQPQEKDKSFYSKYDEGSVECQPQNITKNLTT